MRQPEASNPTHRFPIDIKRSIQPARMRLRPILAAVGLLIVLAGCRINPPPVPVEFPNDPRVVNGTWDIHPKGLLNGIGGMQLSADGMQLRLWNSDRGWLYRSDDDGNWLETTAVDLPLAPYQSRFDTTIDAFVNTKRSGRMIKVTTASIDGALSTTAEVAVPPGDTIREVAAGSGRVFAVTRDSNGRNTLHWWDSLTGAAHGQRSLPAFDVLRVSRNGRMLSFWIHTAYTVSLVDTTAPQTSRTIGLGICRSSGGPGWASADGRWFAANDCRGDVVLFDLNTAGGDRRNIGLRSNIALRFARGSNDLVWFDGKNQIWSYRPTTRHTSLLYEFPTQVATEFWAWRGPLLLDGSGQRLLFGNGYGGLRDLDLERSTSVDLPELDLGVLTMTVTASNLVRGEWSESYDFAGTISGLGPEPLDLHGSIDDTKLLEYHPASQSLAPPQVRGRAEVGVPLLYRLEFGTEDSAATIFSGTLYDSPEEYDHGYVIEMSRR